jgi:hypothetical protein
VREKILKANDLLEKTLLLFSQMKELAEKQEDLVERDDILGFLTLSKQREHLQTKMDRMPGIRQPAAKKGYEIGIKGKREEPARQIAELIASIQEVDQRLEKLITAKKNDLIEEAKRLRRGQNAARGYGAKAVKCPRFLSKRG